MMKSLTDQLADYMPYVEGLPELDQDIYELAVEKRYKQKIIASMKGITQGAVSSRLKRILRRLMYLESLSHFNLTEMRSELQEVLDPMEMEIVTSMAETTCQEETARRLNRMFNLAGDNALTQVKVRHRFRKAWDKVMEKGAENPMCQKYSVLFGFVQDNLYVLYELKHPHFARG